MFPNYFGKLHSDLSELYAALHQNPGDEHLPIYMTSSDFSSYLYFQGSLTGKIFKVLDQFWWPIIFSTPSFDSNEDKLKRLITKYFDHHVLYAYDSRQRRIWNNMRQIDQIWANQLQALDFAKQRKRYVNFLAKELEGSCENDLIFLQDFDAWGHQHLSAEKLKEHRHTIVNFQQATSTFWSLFIKDKGKNAKIRKPLMHLLQPDSLLVDHPLFDALKKEARWVQMEGIMQQAIPVALFAKLDDLESLTVQENRRLTQWVKRLNECEKAISLKLFACVLDEIMTVIQLQGSSTLTLADLLVWLDQQGCQMMHQEDDAHMDWREGLRAGDTIECNGKPLILGEQLSCDKLVDDTFKIFELENYPDYVVKIAHNRFLLLIEDKKGVDEQEHWGVQFVQTIANIEEDDQKPIVSGLDSQGRCVVLEKLSSPVDRYEWKSQQLKLIPEDEKIALIFANHIFCMSHWSGSSRGLSFSHLMWDQEGKLKSTKLLKKGSANYNAWERDCNRIAKKNLYVLNFLMHVSKLNEHPVALYYREAVIHTLKTGKVNLIGRPLPLAHRQEIYNQHIRKLCREAQQLRLDCMKNVMALLRRSQQYSHKEEGQLEKKVADCLVKLYSMKPTPGILLPQLSQEVVTSLTSPSSSSSFHISTSIKGYYEEKHQKMMEYNKACLAKEQSDANTT